MILTRQGWALVGAALALLAAGRFLGTLELFLLGAAAASLVLIVVLRAALLRIEVKVRRELNPARVHAGTPGSNDLEITNKRSRPTPVLRLVDPVSGTAGASLGLAPMEPGATVRAAYQLPTERRGLLHIGPLEVLLADPFGLTSVRVLAAGRSELTVYPRIHPIAALPETAGPDPDAASPSPWSMGRSGEEFFALRPFEIGDELRRVHWPSTARYDELQVRQTELPWQGRATILLDLRNNIQTEESLDESVSVTASIITAARRSNDLIRLVATDGTDSGFVPGNAIYAAMLEYLATVPRSNASSLGHLLDSLDRGPRGGALIVVSAELGRHDKARIDAIGHRYSSVTKVIIGRSAWDRIASAEPRHGSRPDEVVLDGSVPFAAAWNRAMAQRRRTPRVGVTGS